MEGALLCSRNQRAEVCGLQGSVGIDGVSFKAIEEKEGVPALIVELAAALRNKRYKPDPVQRSTSH